MTRFRLVWKVYLEHDLPPGNVILGADLPYGEGATPEDARRALDESLRKQHERWMQLRDAASAGFAHPEQGEGAPSHGPDWRGGKP